MGSRRIFLWFATVLLLQTGLLAQTDQNAVRIAPYLQGTQKEIEKKFLIQVADSVAFHLWAAKQLKVTVVSLGSFYYEVSSNRDDLLALIREAKGVRYIDRGRRKPKVETILGDFDHSVNSVTAIQSLYPSINGTGITVSVKEKPFDKDDLDLKGRVQLNNQFNEPASLHATFMATLSAGGGNTSYFARGAGWGAWVTTSDFDRLLPDNGVMLRQQNVTVQNHSYGVGLENYYGLEAVEYDRAALDFPEILHVFSAGNEGNRTPTDGPYNGITGVANLTGQFKVSKNSIAVGSADRSGIVVSRSSRGPAHDGRVKPEVVAFGDAGSSEAAAVVSGIVSTLQQAHKDVTGMLPDGSLIKGVLINSAVDTGRPNVDFETGFGNVDAVEALRAVTSQSYFTGTVTTGETMIFSIPVPSLSAVRVTLVWNDPAAEPFASNALVNDLDLQVRKISTDEVFLPWVLDPSPNITALTQPAQRGLDRINNFEQVGFFEPDGGQLEIKVTGFSIPQGPQKFYVVYQALTGFDWRYPLDKDALRGGTPAFIRWRWSGIPTTGLLEYKFIEESFWKKIADVSLTDQHVEWAMPDTSGVIQFRMTFDTDQYITAPVTVSVPQRAKVGFACDSEVMVLWNAVANASGYRVYVVGMSYLEPVLTTTDTFAIFQKDLLASTFITINPLFGSLDGARETTIDYTTQGTACYFISFLPLREVITDTARFEIRLGTTHLLKSASLERFQNGGFQRVKKLEPLANSKFELVDHQPPGGHQDYRVTLETTDGKIISSNSVQVFVIRKNEVYVFPNPVMAGVDITILTDKESDAIIELLDLNGRVVRAAIDNGFYKIIPSAQLKGGPYLLRIIEGGARVTYKRLAIVK